MATFNYQSGLGNAASYQVSSKPFVSGGLDVGSAAGDLIQIDFPSVTRWVIVSNHDTANDIRVAFSENGFSTNNYFTISSDSSGDANAQSQRLELKVTSLFLSGTATNIDVVAGLTGIETVSINNNWSGSNGVG